MRVRSRIIVLAVLLLAVSRPVAAQVSVGTCRLSSGSGTPEGVVVGRPCDMFVSTTTGVWYTKWTGTNTSTGWGVGHNTNARVNGNTDLTGYVGLPGYVSQLTGWRIDNLGGADFRYIFTDELHAKSFIADLEQALAGGQIICKSVAVLGDNFTNPAPGGFVSLVVRDLPSAENQAVFQSGDYVGLRTFTRSGGSLTIGDTYGVVTSYNDQAGGLQTWIYTRGSGANGGGLGTSTVVQIDGLVIDYGVSGNGCYEVNAIDGAYGANSPYSQAWYWTTSPILANRSIGVRVGSLRGITAQTNEYGIIAFGSGAQSFLRASGVAFEAHDMNVSLHSGATEVIKLDRTAPSIAVGNPLPSAYATGTGVWMGNDGGTYKFRVGNPAGNRMTHDGTTLSVVGNGAGITDINGGNITTNSINVGSLNATGFGDNVIKNGLFEGGTGAAAIDGWSEDGNGVDNISSCCGTNGPGTLRLDQGTGFYAAATYFAFPVIVGQTYRVSVDLWAEFATSGYDVFMAECDTGSFVRRCKGFGSTVAPDMAITQYVGMCAGSLTAGWQTCTATYTPTAGATWASLSIRQATGTLASETYGGGDTTYAVMHVDNVEVQRKIGAGHIIANSITATQLNFIPVTSTNVVGSINATAEGIRIAGNRISIDGTVTFSSGYDPTGKIASGGAAGDVNANVTTISGGKITTNSITADRLSVGSLSAISADLGSVTSGSISINGGAFQVTSLGVTQIDQVGILDVLQTTGDVYFAQLTGGGNRYVCIDTLEKVFASTTACPDVP